MESVDPHGNAGDGGGKPAEQAGLGCSAFDQIGAESPERTPETVERYQIAKGAKLTLDGDSDGFDLLFFTEAIEIGSRGADYGDTQSGGSP